MSAWFRRRGEEKQTRTRGSKVSRNDTSEQHAEIEHRLLSLRGGGLLNVNEQVGRDGSNDGQGALVALPPVNITLCTSGVGLSSTTLEGGPERGEGGRLEGVDEGL